jgi:hypothetical protein
MELTAINGAATFLQTRNDVYDERIGGVGVFDLAIVHSCMSLSWIMLFLYCNALEYEMKHNTRYAQ